MIRTFLRSSTHIVSSTLRSILDMSLHQRIRSFPILYLSLRYIGRPGHTSTLPRMPVWNYSGKSEPALELMMTRIGSMPILHGSAVRIADRMPVILRSKAMLMDLIRALSLRRSYSHPALGSRHARYLLLSLLVDLLDCQAFKSSLALLVCPSLGIWTIFLLGGLIIPARRKWNAPRPNKPKS